MTVPSSATQPASASVDTVMRAIAKTTAAPGATLVEVPVPVPGPGELLVRVEAASICGTDIHIEQWDHWAQEHFGPPPMVFGHEMAGRVVGRGPGVARIELGQLIGAETHLVDWTCRQCRSGNAHVCQHLRILGVHTPGSFAQYAIVPETNAWICDGFAPEVAAILEPLGNAVHAAFVEPIEGRTVAVLGCGPIGLLAIGVALASGARRIFATDVNEERLEMARRMGAHVVLNSLTDDVVDRMLEETEGDGVEVVLEMSGSEVALRQGLAAITNAGRISLLGTHSQPRTIDLSADVIFKGLRIHGITGRRMFETWHQVDALLRGGLDVMPVITHRLPMRDFATAFALVANGQAGKVVLFPQEA